jgi:hypothetical protein
MGKFKDTIDPERLVEAADASLKAAVKYAEYSGGARPYPVDLMCSGVQPQCLSGFTKWEIQEACEFLVRLGILEKPSARRAA